MKKRVSLLYPNRLFWMGRKFPVNGGSVNERHNLLFSTTIFHEKYCIGWVQQKHLDNYENNGNEKI